MFNLDTCYLSNTSCLRNLKTLKHKEFSSINTRSNHPKTPAVVR